MGFGKTHLQSAAISIWLVTAPAVARAAAPAPADGAAFYQNQVRPILEAHCLSCHGDERKPKGGLRLTSREALLKGGVSGPAVSADKPAASLLLDAVNYKTSQMPPKGKLPQAQIDILAAWVRMGAPFPQTGAGAATTAGSGPPKVDEKARSFWSFRPVVRPEVPVVKDKAWVRNPVDAFVLAKLEARGWKPAPPADKVALLRRACYAVTGLPPAPADVEAFLSDNSPDAYEKVVDRLLASRHFGEHWARHWLDLIRFAETNSFERDGPKPFAWKYRDYVVRSFNAGKPYDQFVREQIAGDEIHPLTRDGVIATGFHRVGIWDDEPPDKSVPDEDKRLSYHDQLDDIVSTTGQTFLGLTVGCGRCHDHKIDPFPQRDYYRLTAFFHGVAGYGNGAKAVRPVGDQPAAPAVKGKRDKGVEDEYLAFERKLGEINTKIAAIEEGIESRLTDAERDDFAHVESRPDIIEKNVGRLITKANHAKYTALLAQRDELNRSRPAGMELALAVLEIGAKPRDTYVLLRGMPANRGDRVEPGFPAVLTKPGTSDPVIPAPPAGARTSGRRIVLADWIASAGNPLTARVMANRLFQGVFGRGIVRSANNFGFMGTPPTHPELLDWLADDLVVGGWRLKRVIRLLLTSSAFRMSALGDPSYAATDPENDLLWRFDLRRLSAEEIRDSILAACGNLNLAKSDGPSVYPPLPTEVLATQSRPGNGWGKSTPQEAAARSVFVYVKRSLAVPQLSVFDAADPDSPCPVRFTTTQPTQALVMLNGRFMNDQAKVFAERLVRDAGADPAAQVRLALVRAVQRPPTPTQIDRGLKYLGELQSREKLPAPEALRRFCLLVLNLNEAVFLD